MSRRPGRSARWLRRAAICLPLAALLGVASPAQAWTAPTPQTATATPSAPPKPSATADADQGKDGARPPSIGKQVTSSTPTDPATAAQQGRIVAMAKASARAKASSKPVPVDTETTEYATTVANPDGTFTMKQSQSVQRVKSGSAWVAPDPSLVKASDGTWHPRAAMTGISFSGGGKQPLAVQDDHDGHVITLTWPSPLPAPAISADTATYPNVLPGVDLVLTATVTSVSEVLVVHDAKAAANPALRRIHFGFTGSGVTPGTTEAGGIQAVDSTGKPVFGGPTPQMWDSSGTGTPPPNSAAAQSSAAAGDAPSALRGPTDSGKVARIPATVALDGFDITPDQTLLTAPTTRYPVFIDPPSSTITSIAHTEVFKCANRANSSYYADGGDGIYGGGYGGAGNSAYYVVRVGWTQWSDCANVGRALMSFNLESLYWGPNDAYGAQVLSATVDVRRQYGNCAPVKLYAVGPFGIGTTWNNSAASNSGPYAGFNPNNAADTGGCPDDASGLRKLNDYTQLTNLLNSGGGFAAHPTLTVALHSADESNTSYFQAFYAMFNGSNDAALDVNYRLPPTVFRASIGNTVSGSNGVTYLTKIPDSMQYSLDVQVLDPDDGQPIRATINATDTTDSAGSTSCDATGSSVSVGETTLYCSLPASAFRDGDNYALTPGRVVDTSNSEFYDPVDPTPLNFTAALAGPGPVSVSSGVFPITGSQTGTTKLAGDAVPGAFHVQVNSTSIPIDHFTYAINADTASALAGSSYCAGTTQCGTAAAAGNAADIDLYGARTRFGVNYIYVTAYDMAGNAAWFGEYDFFVPGVFTKGALGDVTADGIPDIMGIAPDANGNGRLMTFPTNLDPSKSATAGWGGNWVESAPASTAPNGHSWTGALITHRGAERGIPVDDLFAWQQVGSANTGQLYYYFNNLIRTNNPGNSPVDAFSQTKAAVVTRPTCTYDATACQSYAPDWSKVVQILAIGPVNGGTGKTNLLTVEDDGHGHGNLWLFHPAGIGQLTAPVRIGTSTAGWDWDRADLLAPGTVPRDSSNGTLPDLWARDTATGTLWQFDNHGAAGPTTDPGLGNLAARKQLGSSGSFTTGMVGTLMTDGDIDGDHQPDLWGMLGNGQLTLMRGPLSGGSVNPVASGLTATANAWTSDTGVTNLDGKVISQTTAGTGSTAYVPTAAGPFVSMISGTGEVTQLCLQAGQNEGGDSGDPADLGSCEGQGDEAWSFAADGSVRQLGTGRCLDVRNGGLFPATPIQEWDCNGTGSQQWRILPSKSAAGYGSLYNPQSGLCLDDPNSTAGGANLQLWTCNDTNAQQWAFPSGVGATIQEEAENLQMYSDLPPGANFGPTIVSGASWSNGAQLYFTGANDGYAYGLQYFVPIAGLYTIAPLMAQAPNYGKVTLIIDGTSSTVFDGYAPTAQTAQPALATMNLSAGYHNISVAQVGANPAATNTDVGIDRIDLIPARSTPTAILALTPTGGPAPLTVTADASASLPGANPIASYTFDFGDGTPKVVNPVGSNPAAAAKANHSYVWTGAPAAYTVSLTVTDTAGVSTTSSAQVGPVTAPTGPTAALTVAGPAAAGSPALVDASASKPGSTAIGSYVFDFGDGSSSGTLTTATTTHAWASPGTYTVTVAETDGSQLKSTATATVVVNAASAYWVGGTGCLESGPGSQAQPFCTIGRAASLAGPGYTVNVNPGTYSEQVTVANSGTSSAPVVFKSVTPGAATVTGGTNGFLISGKNHVTIDGFTVTGTTGTGIQLTNSAGITVTNTTVTKAGQPVSGRTAYGIQLNSTNDSTVQGNHADSNSDHGIMVTGTSTGNLVAYNEASGNARGYIRAANGIWLIAPGNTIVGNVLHDNEDSGMSVYSGGNNSIVANNVAYDNGDHGIDDNGVSGGVLTGNTVYYNCTDGINVEGTSSNYTIENNISMDNAINTNCAHGPAGADHAGRAGEIGVYDTATTGTTVDYNLVYSTSGTDKLYQWGATGYTTLAAFQNASGLGIHDLAADPRLANAAGGDFHLKAGSPAIDSAYSDAPGEQSADADGNKHRDDPATANTGTGTRSYDDRGAYEYVPGPAAVLALTPTGGGAPLTVAADASASTDAKAAIVSYTFDFGDGTVVGPQPSPTAGHVYQSPGAYTATLTIKDANNATATAGRLVQAATPAPPKAVLTANPTAGGFPLVVNADASGSTAGTSPIASYTFDFGDGYSTGTQTGITAGHSYGKAGIYTLTLTVTDRAGASSTATQQIQVSGQVAPTAALSLTPAAGGPTPLNITVDASASTAGSSPLSTFAFDFGDGTSSGQQSGVSAHHTYTTSSPSTVYTVTVTVTDANGLTATASKQVTVNPITGPTAKLTASVTSGTAPLTVNADASGSTAGSSAITSYLFDFGDGTPPPPTQPGGTISHVYQNPGTYTMKVTVTDANQQSATKTLAITVSSTPPTAKLTTNVTSGTAPLTVNADASGSTAGSSAITSYLFDFGDGTNSGSLSSATASHLYQNPGSYTMRVTVTDANHLTSTAASAIVATSAYPAYWVSGATGCSDTGSGTQAQPFCTIGKAAAKATVAGTTVWVQPGTYHEQVTAAASGASGTPITFKSVTPGAATVTGGTNGFLVSGKNYVTIDGFTVTGTTGVGIQLTGSGHLVVTGNTITYAGQQVSGKNAFGIKVDSTNDSTISNNHADHNSFHGIYLMNGSTRDTVSRNEASFNAEGWQRNANGINTIAPANTFIGNVLHDNEDSGMNVYSGANNSVVVNNVAYNNGDHGIDNNGASGGVLTGNTIYYNCTDGINVEGTASNYTIENNISMDNAINTNCAHGPAGTDHAGRAGEIGIYDTATTGTTIDYNLVYSTSGTDKLYNWGSTGYTTLAAFQTGTGLGAHDLAANPQFTSTGSGDFHLEAGSPAIDSAYSDAPDEQSADADGTNRRDDPGTANTGTGARAYDDRGAYEY